MIGSFALLLAISALFGFGLMYLVNARWGTALVLIALLCATAFFGAITEWTVVKGAAFTVLLYGSLVAGGAARNAADARRQARAVTDEAVFDAHHS